MLSTHNWGPAAVGSSSRPSLKRSASAMSLPTPPSSPLAGQSMHHSPAARDHTPEPESKRSRQQQQQQQQQAEELPATPGPRPGTSMSAAGQSTPPNRVSSNNMDEDEAEQDPFAAPKPGGKTYRGKGFQPRDGKIRSYVYRGKRITLDAAAAGDSDDELTAEPIKPRLLFPSTMESPTKRRNPFILQREGSVSPVKQPAHKPTLSFIPPTPQSLRRPRTKKLSIETMQRRIQEAAEDSDDEEEAEESAWTEALKDGGAKLDADLVCGGETFRPRPKKDKHRLRQGQDFAKKAGGLFFR